MTVYREILTSRDHDAFRNNSLCCLLQKAKVVGWWESRLYIAVTTVTFNCNDITEIEGTMSDKTFFN